MLGADEVEELRSLQARAYGREAALSEAETLRLNDLEDRRVTRAVTAPAGEETEAESPPAAADVQSGAAGDPPASASEGLGSGGADAAPAVTATPSPASASLLSLARAHWRPFAIAATAALVIGVGIGWLAFGAAGATPVALTDEQQSWQADLVASGDYDSGSIRALAVEEGAVIWTATKGERERTCLILSTGDVTVPSCDRTESIAETGIYGAITVRDADDKQRQVGAQMLLTAAGEPAVAVNSYDYEPTESGITYANETESQTAERLVDDGFEPGSLWVIGYDGDVPVWSAMQLDSQNQCLIYDGSTPEAPMTCADPETMQDQASSLVLNVTDVETGEVTHLEMASNQGPSYLVITRQGSVVGAGGD